MGFGKIKVMHSSFQLGKRKVRAMARVRMVPIGSVLMTAHAVQPNHGVANCHGRKYIVGINEAILFCLVGLAKPLVSRRRVFSPWKK